MASLSLSRRSSPPLLLLLCLLAGCATSGTQEATVRAQLPRAAAWSASVWGGAMPSSSVASAVVEPSTGSSAVVSGAVDTNAAHAPVALTADAAVAVAFSASPQARTLRAAFLAEVAAIDAAAAPGALHFSWARLRPADGLAKLALALAVPLDEWLSLPARHRQAYWARAAAAQRAAHATLQLETRVREAWATAVAEERQAALLARAAETAELAAELATRYRDAGALPPREWNAQQQAAAEALMAAGEAGVQAASARAALANLLGVPSTDPRLVLPEALPAPPALGEGGASLEAEQVERALRQRLDLLAARSEVMAQEVRARSARFWSRLPAASAGVERERETDGTRLTGPALEASWSSAGVALERGASADAELAAAAAATLAVEVANEVRFRKLAYQRALDLETLLGERLVQLQAATMAEAQRQQAFMLVGPFDLLEQRRVADETAARAEQQRLAAWSAWFAWQQAFGVAP